VISVVRVIAPKEGVAPPWRIWVELPTAVWERTPEALAKTAPPLLAPAKPEKAIVPEELIPVAAATAPDELTWKGEPEPTDNKDEGVIVPIPILPPFLMVMATALFGANIRSPVEAFPNCKAFIAVAPIDLAVPGAEPKDKVPAMEAIGLKVLTLRTANLAEVVACPPMKKSTVELLG
jgi:hypothetical protein